MFLNNKIMMFMNRVGVDPDAPIVPETPRPQDAQNVST